MVTIYDIAKKCQVSPATVSKALNNYADIGAKTKELVQKTAVEMGYAPNSSAQTLSTKRSYNIGILLEEKSKRGLTHEFFSKIIETIRYQLSKQGYDITFISHYTGKKRTTYLSHCQYRQVDGVIVVCVDFLSSEFAELIQGAIPIVVIDGTFKNTSGIVSDNYNGMFRLTQYLIQQGHTKIGYIHGQKESIVTPNRLKGFFDALNLYNIKVPPQWIVEGAYYDLEVTSEKAKTILSSTSRPTALMICDDYAALSIYSLAKTMNLSIPDDLSIVGFDGTELSQALSPRLTTIKQDTTQIGLLATQKIVALVENMPGHTVTTVNTQLLVGDSVKNLSLK